MLTLLAYLQLFFVGCFINEMAEVVFGYETDEPTLELINPIEKIDQVAKKT